MSIETRPFDPAEHLQDEEAIAVFLSSVLEENNPALLAEAVGTIARADSMKKPTRHNVNRQKGNK